MQHLLSIIKLFIFLHLFGYDCFSQNNRYIEIDKIYLTDTSHYFVKCRSFFPTYYVVEHSNDTFFVYYLFYIKSDKYLTQDTLIKKGVIYQGSFLNIIEENKEFYISPNEDFVNSFLPEKTKLTYPSKRNIKRFNAMTDKRLYGTIAVKTSNDGRFFIYCLREKVFKFK